jgi:hypothetical protein
MRLSGLLRSRSTIAMPRARFWVCRKRWKLPPLSALFECVLKTFPHESLAQIWEARSSVREYYSISKIDDLEMIYPDSHMGTNGIYITYAFSPLRVIIFTALVMIFSFYIQNCPTVADYVR